MDNTVHAMPQWLLSLLRLWCKILWHCMRPPFIIEDYWQ